MIYKASDQHKPSIAQSLLIFSIKLYQWLIRPFLGPCCRYYPSCSNYTIQSIQVHGCIKGSYYGFCRICRCHPYSSGGHDPVPEPHSCKQK